MRPIIFFISLTCMLGMAPRLSAAPVRKAGSSGNGAISPNTSNAQKGMPQAAVAPESKILSSKQEGCVVRVNVTDQPYDFMRPWSKRAPISRRALGVVLSNQRVLVTGELVANASFVELERPEDGEKVVAEVEVVDYQANLALIKPANSSFLAHIKPIETAIAHIGDRVSVLQLESTGALLSTNALVTTAEVSRYPIDDTALLVYRITTSLQYRDGSFTVPVIKEGKLVGLLMRYDPRTQNGDVIASQVIGHFLQDARSGNYRGFPRAGMSFSPMRDAQLRHFAGLNGDTKKSSGVYVTSVQKDGPAARAGIQVGDVLLKVAGRDLDWDGNYQDPVYGKVAVANLISTYFFDGDSADMELLRNGKRVQVSAKFFPVSPQDALVEPFTIDRAPRYHVVGGLVLQELSRQYLKEWGDMKKAPEELVYFERFQEELAPKFEGRKRIIVLTQVLPSECTIGYEEFAQMVVSKINDVPLSCLADVDNALKMPINGFHKIEFDSNVRMIYLDAQQVAEQESRLLTTYGIPGVKRL